MLTARRSGGAWQQCWTACARGRIAALMPWAVVQGLQLSRLHAVSLMLMERGELMPLPLHPRPCSSVNPGCTSNTMQGQSEYLHPWPQHFCSKIRLLAKPRSCWETPFSFCTEQLAAQLSVRRRGKEERCSHNSMEKWKQAAGLGVVSG